MAFVEVGGGLRLHYREWGTVDARSGIVLVHGLGSSLHIWDWVAPLLAESLPRVVVLDQRGHGESDQPDSGYDFSAIVGDLAGFMDAVGLVESSVLVGHSWGASVVLNFGATHAAPTAGIALVDGGTGSLGERMTWEEAETRLRPPDMDGMLFADLLERMSQNNGAYPQARAEVMGRSLFDVDEGGRITRRFRIPNHMQVVRALWEQRPAELLAQVQCPVLLLPARQSTQASEMNTAKLAGINRALEVQPSARVRWFENTVHDVPLQRPEELANELLAFAGAVLAAHAAL